MAQLARDAINLAFEKDVADIIAFDYWSKELDEMKIKARAAAVKAAQEKSVGKAIGRLGLRCMKTTKSPCGG